MALKFAGIIYISSESMSHKDSKTFKGNKEVNAWLKDGHLNTRLDISYNIKVCFKHTIFQIARGVITAIFDFRRQTPDSHVACWVILGEIDPKSMKYIFRNKIA